VLDDLLSGADFVSLHVPELPETKEPDQYERVRADEEWELSNQQLAEGVSWDIRHSLKL